MKRYITAIVAVVLAIGMAAFTAPHNKPLSTFTFYYTPSTFTQTEVQTNSNWISGSSLCGGTADKACQMQVTDTYTHLENNTRVLNTTGDVIVIKAVPGKDGTDYVPDASSSTGISTPVDKP